MAKHTAKGKAPAGAQRVAQQLGKVLPFVSTIRLDARAARPGRVTAG